MQAKVQNKKVDPESVKELRTKLRRGDANLIAEMTAGRYKSETVNQMIRGNRTMKPIVYEAAIKLIETIYNLKNEVK